jgi:EAL domain-containing protein (putative c-di-GMP-specific phosphodiesterase class I)
MYSLTRPDIKAAATPSLLDRGCVHVIDFELIRDKAGGRWDKIKEGVHSRLDAILRQRLSPVDFFAPLNDTSYLVTIPASESDDAEVSCLGAAFDLYKNYLGQFDLGNLSLYRAGRGSDSDTLVLEALPKERYEHLAERAGLFDGSKPVGSVSRGASAAEQPAALTSEIKAEEPSPHFVPMWDTRKEAITSYVCAPRRQPDLLSQADVPAKERIRLELSCLSQGLTMFVRHLEKGERFLMTFRITFDTLGSPSGRTEFVKIFREVSSMLRPYIVFELVEVPEGAPQSRLAELVTALRPFSKAVISQIAIGSRNYAAYQGIGLQAVGIGIRRAKLSPREIDAEIVRLCTSARRIGLSTFLNGVSTPEILRSAKEGGVQFLTGRAIAPYASSPGPMRRLTWDEALHNASRQGKIA